MRPVGQTVLSESNKERFYETYYHAAAGGHDRCLSGRLRRQGVRHRGCGGAERVQFDTALSAIDAGDYLELPEKCEASAYMSDGSTVEEIFVVQCSDKTDASAVKVSMQSLLDSQKQEMERYKPEEVARLDNAIFATYGTCVVLCVTNDTDTANAVIKEFVG